MNIVLTGGGTGGHIIPFAPIIEALRTVHTEKKSDLPHYLEPGKLNIIFAGVVDGAAQELFGSYDVPVRHIPSGKLRRYVSSLTVIDLLFRLPLGIVRALLLLWSIMPDVVISKGGYGSLPVVIAAAFYRIPVLLHESDAVLGASNRVLARLASGIAVGYSSAQDTLGKYRAKSVVTGNPIRTALRQLTPSDGKKALGISPEEFVLLVFGGSQGAKQINEILLAILPTVITDMAIIHVTGPDHFKAVSTVANELLAHSPRKHLYRPFEYLSDGMVHALAAADAIVSRAGSSLAEIAAAHKPSLIIPLDSAAGDHQRKNAQVFEAAGAALVLDPSNVTKHLFLQNVQRLQSDAALRQQLAANVAHLDFPRAARDITELAFYLAQGLRPRQKPRR